MAAEITARLELRRAIDGGPPRWSTSVELAWDTEGLWVCFECRDELAWGTLHTRDAPLWQEEVVEVFLAPGAEDPRSYVEIEVSPLGALFDARVANPDSLRSTLQVETAWDWPGIEWRAGRHDVTRDDWWAELRLPWRGLGFEGEPPALWRANFFRVERPRGAASEADEYSAWSPTFADPADFHLPGCFGLLVLQGAEPDPAAPDLLASLPVLEVPMIELPSSCTG